jgi:hypothetical protein
MTENTRFAAAMTVIGQSIAAAACVVRAGRGYIEIGITLHNEETTWDGWTAR